MWIYFLLKSFIFEISAFLLKTVILNIQIFSNFSVTTFFEIYFIR